MQIAAAAPDAADFAAKLLIQYLGLENFGPAANMQRLIGRFGQPAIETQIDMAFRACGQTREIDLPAAHSEVTDQRVLPVQIKVALDLAV